MSKVGFFSSLLGLTYEESAIGVRSDTRLLVDDAETSKVPKSARDHLSVGVRFDGDVGSLWRVGCSSESGRAHSPKVVGSNPAPATMNDEGLADGPTLDRRAKQCIEEQSLLLRTFARAAVSSGLGIWQAVNELHCPGGRAGLS
jgi:hypothetical protein